MIRLNLDYQMNSYHNKYYKVNLIKIFIIS